MLGGAQNISKKIIFFTSSLSFIFGITIASFCPKINGANEYLLFLLFLISLLFISVLRKNRKLKITALMAVFLFLGIWRYAVALPVTSVDDISFYNEARHEVTGVITSEVLKKNNNQNFELSVSSLVDDNQRSVNGKILIYTNAYPEYEYGDEVKIYCELKTPEEFEGFAYDRYLAMDEIYSICYFPKIEILNSNQANYFLARIITSKRKFKEVINRGLGETEASLARAIIMGDSKNIDDNTRASFSHSGISHIIAISGLHIGIIAGLLALVFLKLNFNRTSIFYATSAILFLFILLVGAPTSAIRAGVMVVLAMYALKIGRMNKLDRVIIFTACLLLLFNPKLLRDDIGFQLSFSAVLGIVYIYPVLEKLADRLKIANRYKLRDVLAVTLAAQIATGGLAVYYFQVIPLAGMVANLLVLWILPGLLISLIVGIILGLVYSPLTQLFFLPAKIIIDYVILISELTAQLPFAYIEKEISIYMLIAYYVGLLIVLWASKHKKALTL